MKEDGRKKQEHNVIDKECLDYVVESLKENKSLQQIVRCTQERWYKQQYKKQKEIINKAIEYIKEHNVLAVNKEHLPTGIERCCSAELLEILGDDKE